MDESEKPIDAALVEEGVSVGTNQDDAQTGIVHEATLRGACNA